MKKIILFLFFIFIATNVSASPSNTMSITPVAANGAVDDASDENSRNNEVSTKFNAHSHVDIVQTGTPLKIGDATAGNKTITANNADTNKPYIRYDDTKDIWILTQDGSTQVAISPWSGSDLSNNTLKFGDGLDNDKELQADISGATDPYIKFDVSGPQWVLSQDGSNEVSMAPWSGSDLKNNTVKFGDGSAGNKEMQADTADSDDPFIRYDDTNDRWVVSRDGANVTSLVVVSGVAAQDFILPNGMSTPALIRFNGVAWEATQDRTVQAWVTFDGTGTIAILDSYNVNSITDAATGDFKVEWQTDFKDTNYHVQCSSESATDFGVKQGTITTSEIAVFTADSGNSAVDRDRNFVLAIGAQ